MKTFKQILSVIGGLIGLLLVGYFIYVGVHV